MRNLYMPKRKKHKRDMQEKDLSKPILDHGKATLFSKVYKRLRRSEGPIENESQVIFIFCLNYYALNFEN